MVGLVIPKFTLDSLFEKSLHTETKVISYVNEWFMWLPADLACPLALAYWWLLLSIAIVRSRQNLRISGQN